jgi:hypothetical protein
VGENDRVSSPELAPPRSTAGIVTVWVVALVAGIVVSVLAPDGWRSAGIALVLAGCLVLSFVVQLVGGRPHRFIQRMAISVAGSFLILGAVSLVVAIVAVFP